MADKKERLVVSILDFLEASIADGTVSADDKDGIEVAGEYYSAYGAKSRVLIINYI
jgi:hypothetical protein